MVEVLFYVDASALGLEKFDIFVEHMDVIPRVGDDVLFAHNVVSSIGKHNIGTGTIRATVERIDWRIDATSGLKVGLIGDDEDEGVDEGILKRAVIICGVSPASSPL